MFTDFLYMLRAYGMDTSLNEWNLLLEALNSNLNECSLDEFYHMSRCILVKKVADYDRFDQAFAAYFKNIRNMDALPPQVMKWLAKTMSKTPFDKEEVDALWENKTLEEIRDMLRRRLEEQKEEHHGGCKWVGTGGNTAYGHDGYAPFGIRVYGGEHGTRRSALEVAGERRFRDFRDDNTMQIRDFQVAFKKLRLLSMRDDGRKTEFNVDRTIEETGKKAGMLQIVMERPRKNQTKLLLLRILGHVHRQTFRREQYVAVRVLHLKIGLIRVRHDKVGLRKIGHRHAVRPLRKHGQRLRELLKRFRHRFAARVRAGIRVRPKHCAFVAVFRYDLDMRHLICPPLSGCGQ